MKTCKCPYCGTEANFISADTSRLPSWPVGIPNRWPKATEHLIGGRVCIRKRLTRSEERRTFQSNALADFRHTILHDKHFTDEGREVILGHLDDAFSPVQGVNPTTEAGHDHDWLCDACGHWNGPNLPHCAMCPRPGSDTC
jgi:hypothetical protein